MRKLSLCVLTPELVAWVPKKSDFHPMNQRVDARADTRVLTAEAQLAQLPQPRRHVVVGGKPSMPRKVAFSGNSCRSCWNSRSKRAARAALDGASTAVAGTSAYAS